MFQKHNGKRSTAALRCSCMLGIVCGSLAHAEEAADAGGQFYGLLRGRDLTPFGSLRLDMRPAHAVAIERGSFAIETEIGYQNTWALSPGGRALSHRAGGARSSRARAGGRAGDP